MTENNARKYIDCNGSDYTEKPEHMTQLFGNLLVAKTDPRIVLRGKLDSLSAKVMLVQSVAQKEGYPKIVLDLQEVMEFLSRILMCEVTNVSLGEVTLFGLNGDELRAHSHHPKKHYGVDHMPPHYGMGDIFIYLNLLRTASREVELDGLRAFVKVDGECERQDIVLALNRISSALYIIMCRVSSGFYKKGRAQ